MDVGQQDEARQGSEEGTNGRLVLLVWTLWAIIALGGYFLVVKMIT